jgi:hypothetical protein
MWTTVLKVASSNKHTQSDCNGLGPEGVSAPPNCRTAGNFACCDGDGVLPQSGRQVTPHVFSVICDINHYLPSLIPPLEE